ncbi:MAG TPA: AmmeMemoRadiSam system radical SAM enzyme [Caulobacteraceae bacterium]|nr:AmmeMemoRadiSam system radical SAM enzyme [Caulobacteraceae bacterium]
MPDLVLATPTRAFTPLADGRVQCDVCPRLCKLHEGQRGLCFVRAAQGGEVVLTTWGRSSGFCVDPIEKKPLNHFLPGTPVLSFGTAGCNLACQFCQNHDISKSRETDTLADQARPETIAAAAEALGCRSVAFTYNDPAIFYEYAIDVAEACHERGIRTVAVTAGYMTPGPRAEFFRHVDAANVDLKAFTEDFYYRLTKAHLAPVLETLEYLAHETDVWLEITTLLIPGENDSAQEIARLARWVVETLGPDVPLHFSAFHPDFRMLDKPRTPPATLAMARRVAMAEGVRHAYVGNVQDVGRQSTFCHQCGHRLIERDSYALGRWGLDERGCCESCGTALAGVFEAGPGTWGPKRAPVRLAAFDAELASAAEPQALARSSSPKLSVTKR